METIITLLGVGYFIAFIIIADIIIWYNEKKQIKKIKL